MTSFRFAHIGMVAALSAATATAVGMVPSAGAVGGGASSYVPIVPCRLADTRPGDDHVGARAVAIGPAEIVPFIVWGTNGNCTIPQSATGIATNVTAVNPTAASYLTVYPADAPARPTASNLNWIPTSPPTPNQVTVALSSEGVVDVFNNGGSVDVIIDIVGYYELVASGHGISAADGATGPQGPVGPQGPQGPIGPQGPAGSTAPKPFVSFGRVSKLRTIESPKSNVVFTVDTGTAPPVGTTCITFATSVANLMVLASPDYTESPTGPSNRQAFIEVRSSPDSCLALGYPAGKTIELQSGYQGTNGMVFSLTFGFFLAVFGP